MLDTLVSMAPLSRMQAPMLTWRRALVHAAVAIGILAMHQAVTAPAHGDSHDHHSATAVASRDSQPVAADTTGGGDHHGAMAMDCCSILMVCMGMIIGLGALLVLTRPRRGTMLRQLRGVWSIDLPPPVPMAGMSIRQRTTILRC